MDEDSAEKAKADRARLILIWCMVLGVVLPLALFCFIGLRRG